MPNLGGFDPTAIHKAVAGEINAIPVKATPVAADVIVGEDSADGFSKKRMSLTDFLDGAGGAGIATGTYVGDGALSNPITGVGFQPVYVSIWERETVVGAAGRHWETTDQIVDDNVAGGAFFSAPTTQQFQTNKIISLDADGFTVDDNGVDAGPNEIGITYNFLCLGSGAGMGLTPSARVRRTTTQSITSGLMTAVIFQAERWDIGDFWEGVTNPTRFTIPKDGIYNISATIRWEPSSGGNERRIGIRLNATALIALNNRTPIAVANTDTTISDMYQLVAGDFIEIMVFQDSGVPRVLAVSVNFSPEATITEMR